MFGRMKILALGCSVLLVACAQDVHTGFDNPAWLTAEQGQKMAEQYLAKRGFADARLVELRGGEAGRFWCLRFATGDVVVAESVVVDRKSGRITLEHAEPYAPANGASPRR